MNTFIDQATQRIKDSLDAWAPDRATVLVSRNDDTYGYMVSVEPAHPESAAQMSFVIWEEGFSATIGLHTLIEADCRNRRAAGCLDFIRKICESVVLGRFQETIWERNRGRDKGRVVASRAVLRMEDTTLRLSSNFPGIRWGAVEREIRYTPY